MRTSHAVTEVRRRAAHPLLLAAGALLCLTASASGQEEMVVDVLNNGKVPDTPVQVSSVGEEGRQPVARTDEDGTASFDPSILNLGKGTPVEVYVSRCAGEQQEVILVPEGEDDPCAGEVEQEGEDCECERIGAFVWGEERVVIDVGRGTVTSGGPAGAGPGVRPPLVTVGFKADAVAWTNLEDLACDQPDLTACEADGLSLLWMPFVELRLPALPFTLGLAGSYASADVRQDFDRPANPLLPDRVDGSQEVWGIEGYARLGWWPGSWLNPYLLLGTAWLHNSTEFVSAFPSGAQTEERSEDGFRFRAGAGADALLTDGLGLRLNLDWVSGGGEDADSQVRFGGGLFLPLP